MQNFTAEELYTSTLFSLPTLFFNNPKDIVENFQTEQSVYETILGLVLTTGERVGTDVLPYLKRFSKENFYTKVYPVYKSGLFKDKKIYDVIVIELLGIAKTKEFKKLYFIYNSDFSDIYSCVAGSSEFEELLSKVFSDTDDDLSITIYNRDNRVLGNVNVNIKPEYGIHNLSASEVKDLYEIFRKILNLGSNYKNQIRF